MLSDFVFSNLCVILVTDCKSVGKKLFFKLIDRVLLGIILTRQFIAHLSATNSI